MVTVAPPSASRYEEPTARATIHSSATVAGWTLISRVTGLLRVVVIGAVLGPTFLANAFLSTNTVPNLVYSVVAGPVLALVIVPALVRSIGTQGTPASRMLLRRLSGLLLTTAVAVAVVLAMASPVLAWVLTVGIPEQAGRGRAQQLTIMMVLFVAPQVVLYTLAALGAAAQQARSRFALAAAAPALENVGLMATMVVAATVYGPGLDVETVPVGMVALLGVGATLSVAVHAAVQVVGAVRAGLSVRPARGWRRDPVAREVAARLRGSVAVAAFPAGGYSALLALSATVRGGVLVFQMAHAVYGVPAALGARAITTAVLPGLAEAANRDDRPAFARSWRRALCYAVVASLPPLCLLVVFAVPVADLLANGELRSDLLVAALAACIAVLAVAQSAAGLHEIGRQALFARIDVRGPRIAGAASFVATVVAGSAAVLLLEGTPSLVGLCVAVLLGDIVAAAIVVARVRRAIRPEPVVNLRSTAAAAVSALTMVPVVAAGWLIIDLSGAHRLAALAIVVAFSLVAVALFALSLTAAHHRWGAR